MSRCLIQPKTKLLSLRRALGVHMTLLFIVPVTMTLLEAMLYSSSTSSSSSSSCPHILLVEGSTTGGNLDHLFGLRSLGLGGGATAPASRVQCLLASLRNFFFGILKSTFGLVVAHTEEVLFGCIAADIGALILCTLASSTTTTNTRDTCSAQTDQQVNECPAIADKRKQSIKVSTACGSDSRPSLSSKAKMSRLPCPTSPIPFQTRKEKTDLEEVHLLTKLAWQYVEKYKAELPSFPNTTASSTAGGDSSSAAPIGAFENKCLGTGPIYTKFLKALKMEGISSLAELLNNAERQDKYFFAFHGTRSLEAMASICCNGLDTNRRCGQAHGKGEYMDTDLSWSKGYTGGSWDGKDGTGGIIVLFVLRPSDTKRVLGEDRYDGLRVVNNPASRDEATKGFRAQLVNMGLTNRNAQKRFFSSSDCLPTYCLPVLAFPCQKSRVPTCLRCTGIADACFHPTVRNSRNQPMVRLSLPKLEVASSKVTRGFVDADPEEAARFLYGYQQACALGNSRFFEGLWEYDRSKGTRKNVRTGSVETVRLLGADMKQ